MSQNDDVYVDSTLLERWFPVAFDVDLSHLRITIDPREKLPIEQRLERQAKLSRLQRSSGSDGHRYPPLALPYRVLAWPAIDNRALDGFFDHFLATDGCRERDCNSCRYCHRVAEEVVRIDPAYRRECLDHLDEVLEGIRTAAMWRYLPDHPGRQPRFS